MLKTREYQKGVVCTLACRCIRQYGFLPGYTVSFLVYYETFNRERYFFVRSLFIIFEKRKEFLWKHYLTTC